MSNGIRLTGSVPPSPNVNSFDAGTATVLRDEKTLMDVALRLGIPEELLRQANPDIDPKNVSPGQDIQIPSKSATTEAAKAPEAFGSDQTSQGQAGAKVAEQKLAGLARQAQLLAQVSPGPTGIGGPVGTTPKNPVDQLTAAVMDGNEKEVERLIKSGIDVNGKDSSLGWTPLTFAVTAGNDKIAELLLKNGARIDEPMQDGHTALTTLAKRDTPGSGIDFLISHGANLNHQDNAGKTALKYSTEKGNKEFVDKLLQSGANPDVKDADQRTALMEAAKSNNKEIVDLLLSKKAKTDIEDKDHNTALSEAVSVDKNTSEVVKALLAGGANPNKPDPLGHTILWKAARKGDSESVTALIGAKAKIDVKDPISDTTPLAEAAKSGNEKSVRALLDAKADPNVKDSFDRTPLMEAALSGNTESVKLLLNKNAKPNLKDRVGTSALQEAAVHGDSSMVKAMLDKGADPNVKDKNTGRTPLMEVAAKGDTDSIEAMKQKKVDLNAQDNSGRTALTEAAEKGDKRAVAALVGSSDYNFQPPFVDLKKNKQGQTALALAKKALQQPTIDTFERSEGKPGLTAYEKQQFETIVEILEKKGVKL